jgi:hypothetical protein
VVDDEIEVGLEARLKFRSQTQGLSFNGLDYVGPVGHLIAINIIHVIIATLKVFDRG